MTVMSNRRVKVILSEAENRTDTVQTIHRETETNDNSVQITENNINTTISETNNDDTFRELKMTSV